MTVIVLSAVASRWWRVGHFLPAVALRVISDSCEPEGAAIACDIAPIAARIYMRKDYEREVVVA